MTKEITVGELIDELKVKCVAVLLAKVVPNAGNLQQNGLKLKMLKI